MNSYLISLFVLVLINFKVKCDDEAMGRIVGGFNVNIRSRPYIVSIGDQTRSGKYFQFCGGALITRKHVLTAAHCYEDPSSGKLRVKLGSTYVDRGGILIRVTRFQRHPFYVPATFNNDIAVVTLARWVRLNQNIKLIPVRQNFPSKIERSAIVSGWGTTKSGGSTSNALKTVYLPLIKTNTCRYQSKYYPYEITDNMFCAGYLKGGRKDACQGDSGGPLVYEGRLLGIVSWGEGCAESGYPGVYTDVTKYTDFLKRATNGSIRF